MGTQLRFTQKGINLSPLFQQREELSVGMLAVRDAEKSLAMASSYRCTHLLAAGEEGGPAGSGMLAAGHQQLLLGDALISSRKGRQRGDSWGQGRWNLGLFSIYFT